MIPREMCALPYLIKQENGQLVLLDRDYRVVRSVANQSDLPQHRFLYDDLTPPWSDRKTLRRIQSVLTTFDAGGDVWAK